MNQRVISANVWSVALFVACLATTSGCGSQTAQYPALGKVIGNVSANGQPISGVMVTFQPVAGNRSSFGTTASDGSFELTYVRTILGAEVGEQEVTFQPVLADDGTFAKVPAGTETKKVRVDVKSGENEFQFDLKKLD